MTTGFIWLSARFWISGGGSMVTMASWIFCMRKRWGPGWVLGSIIWITLGVACIVIRSWMRRLRSWRGTCLEIRTRWTRVASWRQKRLRKWEIWWWNSLMRLQVGGHVCWAGCVVWMLSELVYRKIQKSLMLSLLLLSSGCSVLSKAICR